MVYWQHAWTKTDTMIYSKLAATVK